VIEQRHELAPSDRECKVCGGQLEPMAGQTEDTEEITVEERSYRLVVHRRQKYRCACNSNVAAAPGPPKLIAGGRYSPEFAVHVAVQKYAAHLPLERQVEIMAHQGLETTSQTLWDQLVAAAAILKPSYVALGKWLLGQPLLHVDETGWPVNALDTRKPRWTAWCLCTATAAWFRIASSKSEAEGRQLLGGYSGTVVADGYKVYKNLARGSPGYRLAHCWAHVLRKFRATAESDSRSVWMLERIGELYKRERDITLAAAGNAVEHLALRQQQLKPLLDEIHGWALAQGGLRRSDFGKALAYVLSHWPGLIQLLDDAAVPLDNNPAYAELGISGDMPRPGLCRFGACTRRKRVGPLILGSIEVGIVLKGSQGMRAGCLTAGTSPVWLQMDRRSRGLVPSVPYRRGHRSGSSRSIRGPARERSRSDQTTEPPPGGASMPVTIIDHSDGSKSVVETDSHGDTHIFDILADGTRAEREQTGSSESHDEVVDRYTRPDDPINPITDDKATTYSDFGGDSGGGAEAGGGGAEAGGGGAEAGGGGAEAGGGGAEAGGGGAEAGGGGGAKAGGGGAEAGGGGAQAGGGGAEAGGGGGGGGEGGGGEAGGGGGGGEGGGVEGGGSGGGGGEGGGGGGEGGGGG
jgi:transposase